MIFDMNYIKVILSKKSRTGHFFQNFKYSPVFFYPAFGVKKKRVGVKKNRTQKCMKTLKVICTLLFFKCSSAALID